MTTGATTATMIAEAVIGSAGGGCGSEGLMMIPPKAGTASTKRRESARIVFIVWGLLFDPHDTPRAFETMLVKTSEQRALFVELHRTADARGGRTLCLKMLEGAEGDERLRWGNNLSAAELLACNFTASLKALVAVSLLARDTADHALAGNHYNNSAASHMGLWQETGDESHLDAALLDFGGAAFHYERTHDRALVASAKNNAAALLVALGRAEEAYPKLEEARAAYLKLGEVCRAAEVDETEARARLKAGEHDRALTLAARAVGVLSDYGDGALAEAEETLRAVLEARALTAR